MKEGKKDAFYPGILLDESKGSEGFLVGSCFIVYRPSSKETNVICIGDIKRILNILC